MLSLSDVKIINYVNFESKEQDIEHKRNQADATWQLKQI